MPTGFAARRSCEEPEAVPALAAAWAHGWALCRDVPAPVPEPDGHRIEVGARGHRVRYVLPDASSAAGRAQRSAAPGTWLKVCAQRSGAVPALPPPWQVDPVEYMMTRRLSHAVARAPAPGYTVRVSRLSTGEPGFEVVVLAGDGARAARGLAAVHQDTAVADQVVTEPEHRRCGLGTVVMETLCRVAAEHGARRMVLVATEEGRRLYSALGWQQECLLVPAHVPEG